MIRTAASRVSPPRRLLIASAALVALAAGALAPAAAEAPRAAEFWYRLELGGAPAGWMMVRETRHDDRLVTETETEMTLARGGTPVRLEMASRFAESADGRPLEAYARQVLGPQPIETTYRFDAEAEQVVVRTRQGGRENETRRPWPGEAFLTPARAQRAVVDALARDLGSFTVHTLDPLVGLEVVTTDWRRIRQSDPAAAATGSRWQQRISTMPGLVATVELDAAGTMTLSRTPFMGTEMTLELTDHADARQTGDAPELLARSFVFPDRPLDGPRTLRRAVYRLRTPDGAPDVPSLGSQRASADGDGTLVTVDLAMAPAVETPAGDQEIFLRASTFLDHRAPQVRALADRATAGFDRDAPAADRAESLRRFVAGHLEQKNLDATLATAVEVAQSRAGDCTEHSVLLAALLRADGIPSRVVTGLVYVDRFVGERELFAFHMWTQAWAGERWIDLDATLEAPFDAAHIALAASPLDDQRAPLVEMARVLPLLGGLQIEVVEPAADGDD